MNDNDLSRIEGFRQLKSEIRGSERHLIVGIDIAKSKHHACPACIRTKAAAR